MNAEPFARQLKRLRFELEYKAKDFAPLLGISAVYLSMLERGTRPPTQAILDRLWTLSRNANLDRAGNAVLRRKVHKMTKVESELSIQLGEMQERLVRVEADLLSLQERHRRVVSALQEEYEARQRLADRVLKLEHD